MRLAVATCTTLPPHERDDVPLLSALRARGVEVEQPAWDDDAVDWSRFDAVLIRTTWNYQDKPAAFLAWAERVGSIVPLFNPAPLVAWNTHKAYLRELAAVGVPLASTLWLEAGRVHDLRELLDEHGIVRGFYKPLLGANSRHTLRFDARDPAQLAAASASLAALTVEREMMVQPYLESVEQQGEVSLIYFDDRLSHAVRKTPAPGDYRVQDDWGARDEAIVATAEQLELGERCLAALAQIVRARGWAITLPLLYARIDMLRDDAGAWVLNELEIVEPSLFFRHGPEGPWRLADALLRRMS